MIEEPQATPDGKTPHAADGKVPLHDAGRGDMGVLGTYIDITERAQALQEAEEARELLHYVVQHDPGAVAVLDEGPALRLRRPGHGSWRTTGVEAP